MKLVYKKSALKFLSKLSSKNREKIVDTISFVLLNFKDYSLFDIKLLEPKKLKIYRLRIGKYRVIFKKEDNKIIIIDIDTRGDVYKNI